MGLFSKKPKPSATEPATASVARSATSAGTPTAAARPGPAKPAKGKKHSVDPVDFLALRSEMMELRARLDASEQAKALVETRLAALDATTTAMSTQQPSGGSDLRTQVTELQAQLEEVAETAAAAHASAQNAAAKATAAATVATNAANNPGDTASVATPAGNDSEMVARIDALTARLETVSTPDPTIAARLDALAARIDTGPATDPGLLARLDQLSARIESAPDAARVGDLEARLGLLAAKADQAAEAPAPVASGPDDDTVARIDALAERVGVIDSFSSQLSQLNARVSAQAEFGAQLGSLRDRISELSNETEERRAAALAATGDADLRDRVNSISDRISSSDGIAAQIAQLAERVAANDTTTRQAAEQVAAIEQRLSSVSTELANQVSELGRDIDGLAAHSNEVATGSVSDEVIDSLKSSQVKLAAEQARYEIAFRQDLAVLAEQVRRKP